MIAVRELSWAKLRELMPWPLRIALTLWLVFLIAHGAGLRDFVSMVSGTPVAGVPMELAGMGAAFYVVAYFAAVLIAPILALTALFSWIVQRAKPAS
jgi:hypothetical protein